MIFSFAITGVSAQKIEWKYSTPNNYWETEKNIKWSDTPEQTGEIIRISDEKAQYIDGLGGTFNELGWDALCTLPEEKKNEILYICSARRNPTIPIVECLSEPVISL